MFILYLEIVVFFGSIIFCIISCCSFHLHMFFLGLGFGLSTVLHMIVVNQYFDKFRATALGLGYSGDCFGSFVFPIFIEHLFANYDVRGSFLIIGAVVLNVIPLALLLRKPPWLKEERSSSIRKAKTIKSQKHPALEKNTNILSYEKNKIPKTYDTSSEFSCTINENEIGDRGQMNRFEANKCIKECKKISAFPHDLKGQYNEAFDCSETDLNALNKENNDKITTTFTLGISENSFNRNKHGIEVSESRAETDTFSYSSNENVNENVLYIHDFYTPAEMRTSRSASELLNKRETLCSANRSLRLEKKPYSNLQGKTETLPPLFEKEKIRKDGSENAETTEMGKKSADLENEYPCSDANGTLRKRTTSFASQVAHEIVNKMRTASFASQVAQDGFVANINQETEAECELESECELKSIVEHKDHDADNCTRQDRVLSVDKNVTNDYFKPIPDKSEARSGDKPSTMKILVQTNTKPMFILISMSMAVYAFLFVAIVTIIIDYAEDQGIPADQGKYLIIGFSIADLIGRLTFGQVIDRKLMKIKNYAGSTMLIMGILSASIPLNVSYNYMMVLMSLYGGIQGGTAIMFPILVNTYMDKNSESVAMGCLNFYGGLLILLMAPMIGKKCISYLYVY